MCSLCAWPLFTPEQGPFSLEKIARRVDFGMKKVLCLVLLALLVCPWSALALTVTDGMGRQVAIDKTPETCVSLTPANTEILFALGLQGKLVGVDNQSDYPAEALAIEPKLGGFHAPNIEAIVALKPDVVFAGDKLQKDAVAQLENLGMTVVCNDPTSFDGVIPGIELIAQVMGVDPSAVTGEIKKAEEEVTTKVYFALSFGDFGNYTAGPGTFIDDMIRICRGTNVAGNMPVSWPEYSIEQLVLDDPDVILVSDYAGDGSVEAQLSATPGYSELRAVKEGHVYGVDANITSRSGPRMGEALRIIDEALSKAK